MCDARFCEEGGGKRAGWGADDACTHEPDNDGVDVQVGR